MRQELDDLLCQRYPDIFRDRHGDRAETGMCWGFGCGDGWFDIIDGLCAEITSQVKAGTMPPVVASQVKEKSGYLRFYIRGHSIETTVEKPIASLTSPSRRQNAFARNVESRLNCPVCAGERQ